MPSRNLATLVATFSAPDSSEISPPAVAAALSIQIQEFASAAGVHPNTLRVRPDSPKLQDFLRNLVRAISAISILQPDDEHALFFFMNFPIPTFRHKSAYQLVVEGRTEDLVAYLESLEAGYIG